MYLADGLSENAVDHWVPSASVLHSNGDGLDIAVKDGRIAGVRGRVNDRSRRMTNAGAARTTRTSWLFRHRARFGNV